MCFSRVAFLNKISLFMALLFPHSASSYKAYIEAHKETAFEEYMAIVENRAPRKFGVEVLHHFGFCEGENYSC